MPGETDLTPGERGELVRLRAENALLRTEKAILLKAATGFAIDAGALPPAVKPLIAQPEPR